ncbi:MAG: VRR-NUC domain-containing protein [Myxococcales bacterium]|nr:VRR-NUC domain-containing protein [Myxococcales bacterium]
MTPRSPLPAEDLRTAVIWALQRESHLFAAGERVVLAAILALSDDAAELYARLNLRVGDVFRVAGLAYACASTAVLHELDAAELITHALPDALTLPAFTAHHLRAVCARLGLPRNGPRADLEARLAGRRWRGADEDALVVRHRQLLERVERLGGYDRRLAPLERIAGTRWAEYGPTSGAGAFADRRAMLTYERARRGELAPDEALRIARTGPPPWGRSPFRYAVAAVLDASPDADVLAGIPGLALQTVRALEHQGRRAEALDACRKRDIDPETALAIARTGKRLARALGQPWKPAEPLRAPPERRLWLVREGIGPDGRPTWRGPGDGGAATIEAAVLRRIAAAGREAIHAENWLWSSLFALVFRELYWAPLPGRLPTARRGGPTDLGTPAFYEARRALADATLGRLRTEGFAPFAAAWSGERLDGLIAAELSLSIGRRLDGELIATVLHRILRLGWSAARGLPDLLVLTGPTARMEQAIPSILPECSFFAEVKGPTDTLRDAQRLWHDNLVMSSQRVEIWYVTEHKIT